MKNNSVREALESAVVCNLCTPITAIPHFRNPGLKAGMRCRLRQWCPTSPRHLCICQDGWLTTLLSPSGEGAEKWNVAIVKGEFAFKNIRNPLPSAQRIRERNWRITYRSFTQPNTLGIIDTKTQRASDSLRSQLCPKVGKVLCLRAGLQVLCSKQQQSVWNLLITPARSVSLAYS